MRRLLLLLLVVAAISCGDKYGETGSSSGGSSGSSGGGVDGGGTVSLGGLDVTPSSLELKARCGVPGKSLLSLTNTTDKAIDYELRLPDGVGVFIESEGNVSKKGSLAAKANQIVDVVVATKTAQSILANLLVITNGSSTSVQIRGDVLGGALVVTPANADFGEIRQNTVSTPIAVMLSNTGTEAVVVTGWTGSSGSTQPNFAISASSGNSLSIAPNTQVEVSATMLAGVATSASVSGTLTANTQAPLCGDPAKISLTGKRVPDDVTVSPVSVDTGDLGCNASSAKSYPITVTNYSTQSATYVVSPAKDSWFSATTLTGTLQASGTTMPTTQTIGITLKPPLNAPLGVHSEIWSIQLSGPVQATKQIKLETRIIGAILDITPTVLTGFTPAANTKQFTIKNTGNIAVYLTHSSSAPSELDVVNPNSFVQPSPLLSTNVTVKLNASSPGLHQADIKTVPNALFQSGPICNPPPIINANTTL